MKGRSNKQTKKNKKRGILCETEGAMLVVAQSTEEDKCLSLLSLSSGYNSLHHSVSFSPLTPCHASPILT